MSNSKLTKWGIGFFILISVFIISVLINPETYSPDSIDFVIALFHLPGLFVTYYWIYWNLKKSKSKYWTLLMFLLGFVPGLALNYLLLDVIDFSSLIGLYFVSPFSLFGQFVLLIPFVLLGFVHFGIDSYQQSKQLEIELSLSKKKEQEFKESLLKSQIQPHFLFNALNTLYALARKKDKQSPDAILELSQLLRYTVDSNNTDWVFLESEISFLKAYCGFQEKRFSADVKITIDIQIVDKELKIAPLLFQPLIENAFKYVDGENTKEIHITLNQTPSTLSIEVQNTCIPKNKIEFGQGIQLVKKRLENSYGKNALFTYGFDQNNFKAQATINLT